MIFGLRDVSCEDFFTLCQSSTTMGGATRGCGGTLGTMSPTFGTRGYRGVQGGGPMKMIFASTAVFIQYCISDWISTPLTHRHLRS